jgi:hypothetical protein
MTRDDGRVHRLGWLAILAFVAFVLLLGGCKRRHVPVGAGPELGYPACGDAGVDERGEVVGQGHLRAGPLSVEKNVVERFELRRTRCGYTLTSRQEWPLAIADVQVRYDTSLLPIWAWKRMTIAGSKREDGNADIRRYELRTGDVFIKRRDPDGALTLEKLLPGGRARIPEGATLAAVVGPGRGMITAWLQRAHLPPRAKTHDLVLDFREMVESLEEAALERHEDQFEESLGRTVRVYTFFGRETVFADDNDVVVGDLAGMRPSATLTTPEPDPLPTYGGPDPVHTP